MLDKQMCLVYLLFKEIYFKDNGTGATHLYPVPRTFFYAFFEYHRFAGT